MKKIVYSAFVLLFVFVLTAKVSAQGNTFTEIRAFQTEDGPRLLLRYDYTGHFGAYNLQRAVSPNDTYMPPAPGEVVQMYFDGNTIVWILDLDKLGRQRTFRVLITD